MSKARLEAFSDGVLAVAITLLVLNIVVPSPNSLSAHQPHETLAHALAKNWPSYAAYVISFLTIGIIWLNHHVMISRLREVDHRILILNLVLLMTIGVIPFATDLMATYLKQGGGDAQLGAALYGASFLLMSLAFTALNRHILFPKAHLMQEQASLTWRRATLRRASVGVLPYVVATALALLTPYATIAICGALAVFYASPVASDAGIPTQADAEIPTQAES